jgi:predicted helicase
MIRRSCESRRRKKQVGHTRLHLDYEKLDPWPLEEIENKDVPLSYRVADKMRLSKDKAVLTVNPSLSLAGIPTETPRPGEISVGPLGLKDLQVS